MILQRLVCLAIGVIFAGQIWAAEPESPASPPENQFKARIGVEIGYDQEFRSARLRGERVLSGDQYRIYVAPESGDGYVYIITIDDTNATFMTTPEPMTLTSNELFMLPALNASPPFYQVKNDISTFAIVIVCSVEKLPELAESLPRATIPVKEWQHIEQALNSTHNIELFDQLPEKPWTLAGGTRSIETLKDARPQALPRPIVAFVNDLKISSGETLVIKRYEFRVHAQK